VVIINNENLLSPHIYNYALKSGKFQGKYFC